jgi:hypothetical protein
MRSSRFLHFLVLTTLLLSACASADPSAAQTAAAATLDAGVAAMGEQAALQTSEAENAALQATVAALATQNAMLQTQSTATAIAEATLAAVTPQLIAPSGANCRFGADGSFAKVADLKAGQAYNALGRSLNGEWWQIASPDNDGSTCWVFWSQDLDFLGEVFNLPMLAGPALPTATYEPTHAPGISVRFVDTLTCNGLRYAIARVRNLGTQTYQSAIVGLSDSSGNELNRSDGNNEFLATGHTCPGGEPELKPGQEKFVAVVIKNAASGDTILMRVTVCTEKGYRGDCFTSSTSFTN